MIQECIKFYEIIENIIIKGNTKTKDYVIEREIPLESGDIFSNTKIMNGIRAMHEKVEKNATTTIPLSPLSVAFLKNV